MLTVTSNPATNALADPSLLRHARTAALAKPYMSPVLIAAQESDVLSSLSSSRPVVTDELEVELIHADLEGTTGSAVSFLLDAEHSAHQASSSKRNYVKRKSGKRRIRLLIVVPKKS